MPLSYRKVKFYCLSNLTTLDLDIAFYIFLCLIFAFADSSEPLEISGFSSA